MILACRIPTLTAQMKAARVAATNEARDGRLGVDSSRHAALEHELVELLERRGYRVTRAPLAA